MVANLKVTRICSNLNVNVITMASLKFEFPVLDPTEPQVVLDASDSLTANSVVSECVQRMDTSDPLEEFKCELVLEISEPVVNASTSAETVEPSPDATLSETVAGPITVPGKALYLLSSEILFRWNLRRVFQDLGTAEQCIKFAEERRLIPTMRMCSRHRCPMRLSLALNGQFGVFRCSKRNCRSKLFSRATGTWFEKVHLPIPLVFQLMYMFSHGWLYDTVKNEASDRFRDSVLSTRTINTWFTNCRDVIVANESKQSESYENKIGGPNRVVQIHVSQFGKRKCKGGKVFEGHWVLGMVEDGSDDLRLEVCPDNQHTADVLVPFIRKHVTEGSIIHTDFSTAYDSLSQHGYTHNKVCYGDQSKRIVAPDGTITQRIESHLMSLKMDFKRDQLRGDFTDWLVEKTWRRKNRIYHRDPFEELLTALQNVYGINCSDPKFRVKK